MRRVLTIMLLAVAAAGCGGDEAALVEAGESPVRADIGELRVVAYDDDPATDHWQDVVTPDAAVFEEGESFREADSRTADDDQAAEQRRLFTAMSTGRTLLVVVNCDPCRGSTDLGGDDVLVWELVTGQGSPASGGLSGHGLAIAGETLDVAVGDLFAVARRTGDGAFEIDRLSGGVDLIAGHDPGGGDLHVDVFVAAAPGLVEIVYGDPERPDAVYPIAVT